jgi:OFA family oxalate/formate antiporter-like MFS transporter
MPAFAADYFGSKNVGPIYGLMLTAWGFASYVGPQLLVKLLGPGGSYTSGLRTIAIIMLVSTVLPIVVSPPTRMTSLHASKSATEGSAIV